MLDKRNSYSSPMIKFLNDYSSEMNKQPESELDRLRDIFDKTIKVVYESLGEKAFRPVRSLNAAVFDSAMVGIAERLAKPNPPPPTEFAKAYGQLIERDDYKKGWIRSTADEDNVKLRMETAIKAFEAI
jgi:hypothetical protein